MKQLALTVILLGAAAAVCLAQAQIIPLSVSSPETRPVNRATGRVDSVSIADPGRGLRSEIVMTAKKGGQLIFLVKATTTIYDTAWQATSLNMIEQSDKIKVKYITTSEGLNEALSIRLLRKGKPAAH